VRLRDFNAPEQERDELWTQLIDHYIAGPRQAWAAALLEVMRVDLLAALGALPAITCDDIAQQLATEVLATALEGPTNPARWTRHRLITRATTSVQQLLVDELRSAADESEPPPQPDGSSQVSMQLRELMVDIEAGRMPLTSVSLGLRLVVRRIEFSVRTACALRAHSVRSRPSVFASSRGIRSL
jgi:hypothetical protein